MAVGTWTSQETSACPARLSPLHFPAPRPRGRSAHVQHSLHGQTRGHRRSHQGDMSVLLTACFSTSWHHCLPVLLVPAQLLHASSRVSTLRWAPPKRACVQSPSLSLLPFALPSRDCELMGTGAREKCTPTLTLHTQHPAVSWSLPEDILELLTCSCEQL